MMMSVMLSDASHMMTTPCNTTVSAARSNTEHNLTTNLEGPEIDKLRYPSHFKRGRHGARCRHTLADARKCRQA